MYPCRARMYDPGYDPWALYYSQVPFYPEPYSFHGMPQRCPTCHQPSYLCHCNDVTQVLFPEEAMVSAANSPKELFIGGACEVRLTLEYMPIPEAAAPAVQVAITDAGSTSTWSETAISEGYHTKNDFSTVKPGARVTVTVTDSVARLRWCEVLRL